MWNFGFQFTQGIHGIWKRCSKANVGCSRKHWRFASQERKKKRKKEQKTISILFTFSWIYRSTSFRKLQKNGLLSIQSPEAKRFDVYAYRYSKLTVVSIFNCTEQTRTASSDGIIRILTNTLVTQWSLFTSKVSVQQNNTKGTISNYCPSILQKPVSRWPASRRIIGPLKSQYYAEVPTPPTLTFVRKLWKEMFMAYFKTDFVFRNWIWVWLQSA